MFLGADCLKLDSEKTQHAVECKNEKCQKLHVVKKNAEFSDDLRGRLVETNYLVARGIKNRRQRKMVKQIRKKQLIIAAYGNC